MALAVWGIEMGNIFMRILNPSQALETLLYVFRNQMELGKKKIVLTLKHQDGFRDYCTGTVDEIFKNDFVKDIEYCDMLLLEHFPSNITGYIYFNDNINMETLSDMSMSMKDGCYFIFPRGTNPSYIMIKNHPMFSYTVYRNELISDSLFGSKASVLNNMCGKIDYIRGLYVTIKI